MIRTLFRSLFLPVALLCVWGATFVVAANYEPAQASAATHHGPTLCGVEAQHAGEPHACLVTQCAAFGRCERFIIPAYPQVGELGEATARHMVEVETCILYKSGSANDCSVRLVPKGDQIIAWGSDHA